MQRSRSSKNERKRTQVRFRSLVIGSILIPVNLYWLMKAEVVWVSVYSTVLSLFFNVVFCLFALALVNILSKRYLPRLAMNQGELLTIYVMLSIATGIFGHDFIRILIHTMGAARWFASPENEWADLFFRYLPEWLVIDDSKVLQAYYEGDSTLYTLSHIKEWYMPVLAWSGLILVVVYVMICINVIIRKQWTENEKLTYPIIQLPLEMTSAGFFKSRLLWLGFAIVGALEVLNGFSFLFPTLPSIRLKTNIGVLFTEAPFSAIGWTPLCFYPFILGLSYFMPLDLSFSLWFFYIFWKIQLVVRSALGFSRMPGPYLSYQSSGAWLGIGLLALWTSRRHLMQVLKRAAGRKKSIDDSREPMRYRTAILGIIGGITAIILFCYQAGMSVWVVLLLFTIYFLILIAIARMRAELGPPTHDLYNAGPERIVVSGIGARKLGPGNLTMFSLLYWLGYGYRSHPMGHQLEGFKIAERLGIDSKKLLLAMMVAAFIGVFASFWIFLHVAYNRGSQNFRAMGIGRATFYHLQTWLSNPPQLDYPLLKQAGFGMVFTFFLMFIRRIFFQFPLHPVGYAVAGSWTMSWMWFSIFTGWIVKQAILRFGGPKVYRNLVPLFLGMILGQYIMGSLWTLLSEVIKKSVYGFFP